jgi:hypothetical protein
MSKINDTNNICRRCGKPTQVLFHKERFCPDCEGKDADKKDNKDKIGNWDSPFGWELVELGKDEDAEDTDPMIDLSDFFKDVGNNKPNSGDKD